MRTLTRTLLFSVCAAVLALGGSSAVKAQSAIGTVVTISGFVLDQNTLLPVEANYSVYDAKGGKVGQPRRANPSDGYLVTGLKPGESYTIRVEDPRYFKDEFVVALPSAGKYTEVSKDFIVRKMEAGKKLSIDPPPFDLRKADVKEGTEDDLRSFARMLVINPGVKVELVCYPDEELPANRARQISEQRANALKTFLVNAGVSADRITVKPASTTDPLNPPPLRKGAKGKRYIGPVYVYIASV